MKKEQPLPYTPAGWRRLPPTVRSLLGVRLLRSVGQGALIVDFALYLKALGWSATAIGSVLGAAGLVGALLIMLTGPLSDRVGRRSFLVGYETVSILLVGLLLLFPSTATLTVAAILLGFGRGANGAAGPFGPVEQAWLSQYVPRDDAGRIFSMDGAFGSWGMGLGALVAGLVPWWSRWLPGPGAYMPLFWLVLVISALNLWQIARLPDNRPQRPAAATPAASESPAVAQAPAEAPENDLAIRRRENRSMALLAAVNSINALGIGLFSPLLPLWFATRFGADPSSLGSIFGLSYVLNGVSSLITGELADRKGLVRTVVWVRLAGVLMLVAIPIVPSYGAAAALYVIRTFLNRGSAGIRQAFGVNLVRKHRRGLASSVNALSMRLPSSIGPSVAGWMLSMGWLSLPTFIAAGLQLAYVVLFGFAFRQRPAEGAEASA
jgi:MFS family permease